MVRALRNPTAFAAPSGHTNRSIYVLQLRVLEVDFLSQVNQRRGAFTIVDNADPCHGSSSPEEAPNPRRQCRALEGSDQQHLELDDFEAQ